VEHVAKIAFSLLPVLGFLFALKLMDGYKLILYPKIGKARLYNLAEDPKEMNDLAGDPASRPVMKRLFARLLELQEPTGDTLDLKAAFPEL